MSEIGIRIQLDECQEERAVVENELTEIKKHLREFVQMWNNDASKYKQQANELRSDTAHQGANEPLGMDYQAGCLLGCAKQIKGLLK